MMETKGYEVKSLAQSHRKGSCKRKVLDYVIHKVNTSILDCSLFPSPGQSDKVRY